MHQWVKYINQNEMATIGLVHIEMVSVHIITVFTGYFTLCHMAVCTEGVEC